MRTNRYFFLALAISIAILWIIRQYLATDDINLANQVFTCGLCSAMFIIGLIAWRSARGAGARAMNEELHHMRQEGLLSTTTYNIRRAFRLAEYHKNGPHYFLEQNDGTTLVLYGTYLYQEDGRHDFPNTRFIVERHSEHNYVVDLLCDGEPIPLDADLHADATTLLKYYPECDTPEEARDLFENTYADNSVLEETYDAILTRLQETQPGQPNGI